MKKRKGFVLAILLSALPGMLLPETAAAALAGPAAQATEEPKELKEQPRLETAEAEIEGAYQFGDALSLTESGIAVYSEETADEEALKEYLYQSLMQDVYDIDISDYGIPVSRLNGIIAGLLNEHPDLYFVDQKYVYSFVGGSVCVLTFNHRFRAVDSILDKEAFYKETRAALSVVKDGMSDLQKVIALHDYLAVNCEYDYENYLAHTVPQESHSAYGVLVNHLGVCDGYALAYSYLLGQVGIPCYLVTSEAMHHAWNLVELDGLYYHVDVTWDDPTWDLVGRACHQYMLKSGDALARHYDWVVEAQGDFASDTRYDNAFWNDVNSPLVLGEENRDDCYYVAYDQSGRKGQIKKASLSDLSDSGTEVANIGKWMAWGGGAYWQNAYSGLFQYQNRLYFNDTSSIYSIAKDGTDKREEFTADTTDGYIYGSALCQGNVRYSLHQEPILTERETVLTADIAIEEEEPPEFPVREIALSEDGLVLAEEETASLQASLVPAYTTDSDISWESGDTSVAIVENGTVTAVSAGSCEITAMAGELTAVCEVMVCAGYQQGDIAGGRDGGIVWRIDANGTLTAEGNGDFMARGLFHTRQVPWMPYQEEIKAAKISVSNMTNVSSMFFGCTYLESVDLSGCDMSRVTAMSRMFHNCSRLEYVYFGDCDTSQVTDMSGMFSGCSGLSNLDVGSLDTSRVTNMSGMFSGCSGLSNLDVGNFDTSRVTDMSGMFSGCSGLSNLDVGSLDTSRVTNMSGMFRGCSGLSNLDVGSFDTSRVTNMSGMFRGCSGLSNLDVGSFDTSSVINMREMFSGCSGLSNLDVSSLDTSGVLDMSCMFADCRVMESLDMSGFDTSSVKYMMYMFKNCYILKSLDLSGFNTGNVSHMSGMFNFCRGLTDLDVSGFDTGKAEDMSGMFWNCFQLENLDVSGFDTSSVTDMKKMFDGCDKLTSLDVSGFDTSGVQDMSYMFEHCEVLESLDVSGFDTSGVTDMKNMFHGCCKLTSLDVSGFDTSGVTNMSYMFKHCEVLESLDVSGFDTSRVTDMSDMFAHCEGLESLDVSGFNTGNARSMSEMFYRCSQLDNLDLGNFDMSLENIVEEAFIWYCKELMTVTLPANLTQEIYFPSQAGRHWEDENGERRSIAALGLPSVMTYRSVADEEPNPPSGEEEKPNPPSGEEEKPNPPSGGEDTNLPSGGDKEPSSPSGGEKPNPSGGGEGQNPSGGDEKPQPAEQKKLVQSIALTGISKKIAAGKSIRLTAEIYPKNADNRTLVWTSSDPKCASVSQTGKVSVKKDKKNAGKKVTITATAADGSGVKASYCVTVMKDSVKKIKLTAPSSKVKAGKTVKIKAKITVTGKKANRALAWSSSNPSYATVSKSGKVKTKKAGKGHSVTITAKSTDGSGKKKSVRIRIK